jgi:hypothetical protein
MRLRFHALALFTTALVFVASAIDSSEDDIAGHGRATSRTAKTSVIDSTNRRPTGGGKYPFLAIVQWNASQKGARSACPPRSGAREDLPMTMMTT